MLLHKTLQLSSCELKMAGDSGRFEGWASIFDKVDSQGDVVVRGAYAKSLAKNGLPKMFYNHDWHMPVGRYTDADERTKGLWVVGELTPGHSLASDVTAAMRHHTLDGLSVGGMLAKGDYRVENDVRFISTWSNLMEVSPCVFPANVGARIDLNSVKSGELAEAIADIESIRDLERFLRDAGNFSKGAATALVARVKAVLGVEGEPVPQSAEAKAMQALHERILTLGNQLQA